MKDINSDNEYNTLLCLCEKYKAELKKFTHYKNVFGNYDIEIVYNKHAYSIITDKSEIYINSDFICGNSYHVAGQNDTFKKLLETIKTVIFNE